MCRARRICRFETMGDLQGLLGEQSVTLLRLEGVPPSVSHRVSVLAALLKPFGAVETLAEDSSRSIWRTIRDARPLADAAYQPVWRISTAPTQGAVLGANDRGGRPAGPISSTGPAA